MGGGLKQLVYYGAQDIYLTGNPQITFFKVVYRRHTNFSIESIEQALNGTFVNGACRQTATISRNGDLVSKLFIQKSCTGDDDFNLANPGYTIMENVEIEIGGERIDIQTGNFMANYAELTEPNPTGRAARSTTNWTTGGDGGTLFQMTTLAGGVSDNGSLNAAQHIFVPLQFWFCRNPGLALPLIALQYHEVKIIINWTSVENGNAATAAPTLWADYIYLDTDERRRFAQVSHEYLIEQVQHQSFGGTNTDKKLQFSHPVKELIWTGAVTAGRPAALDGTYKLQLNGHDRFAARDFTYFTRTQVWQYHTGYGGVVRKDGIAVYSFALKPEEHQPSGTCNFSRINKAKLIQGTGASIEVYAINYNVLRIMSGMSGLAYSN